MRLIMFGTNVYATMARRATVRATYLRRAKEKGREYPPRERERAKMSRRRSLEKIWEMTAPGTMTYARVT